MMEIKARGQIGEKVIETSSSRNGLPQWTRADGDGGNEVRRGPITTILTSPVAAQAEQQGEHAGRSWVTATYEGTDIPL